MRLACVGGGWYPQSPGGLEKYVLGMAEAALRAGDEVDLFVVAEPINERRAQRFVAIADPKAPLWRRALQARRSYRNCFRGPYDVIDIHFAMNALPLVPFVDRSIPRVIHFHGPWAGESVAEGDGPVRGRIKAALERYVYRQGNAFIVLSHAFKDVLAAYGVDPSRIHVIPMGIDCTFFRPAWNRASLRTELNWPQDRAVFFTARRLVRRVGLHELLTAARMMREAGFRFLVKIAGKGPLRDELERTIADQGLADCVELLGFISETELVRAYQAADLTVLPSQTLEGFGTIISESLACGTPVVVTPVGGMPEAVEPLAQQLVTSSARPEAIAEHLAAVLTGTLVLPDSHACRSFAKQSYDWELVYRQVRAVFSAVAEGRESPITMQPLSR